jgi:hypothetical protein
MLYEMTVPLFAKSLTNLDKILDKGAAYADSKKVEMSVLLNSRLAVDQFPLIKQVQIAADSAKLCCARLTGKEAPVNDDKETTLPELKKRLADTIKWMKSLNPSDFNGTESKKITTPRWEGKWMTGSEYVHEHALPNVHFHVTTAYAILRHNGVDVGKKDFLGEMPFKQ